MIYLLVLLAIVVIPGALLVLHEEWPAHPTKHTFKPDAPFGRIARCKHTVQGWDGDPEACGLSHREHEEVHGRG